MFGPPRPHRRYGSAAACEAKCVIYTCLRETFPHLNAALFFREGETYKKTIVEDILIYNSFFFIRA